MREKSDNARKHDDVTNADGAGVAVTKEVILPPKLDCNYSDRWLTFYFKSVLLVAEMSKDVRSHVGAVLVRDKIIISEGYNGLPRNVDYAGDFVALENKYFFFVHAETNAVLNAAYHGIKTAGADVFISGMPCATCARSMIQAGINCIYFHKSWNTLFIKPSSKAQGRHDWLTEAAKSQQMLAAAGVGLVAVDLKLGGTTLCAGELVAV